MCVVMNPCSIQPFAGTVPDCDFFVNKRDHPMLRHDLREPYDFLFDDPPKDSHQDPTASAAVDSVADCSRSPLADGAEAAPRDVDEYGLPPVEFPFPPSPPPPELQRCRFETYAPICSYYTPEDCSDLQFPCQVDWQMATGGVFPPLCIDHYTPEKLAVFQVPLTAFISCQRPLSSPRASRRPPRPRPAASTLAC